MNILGTCASVAARAWVAQASWTAMSQEVILTFNIVDMAISSIAVRCLNYLRMDSENALFFGHVFGSTVAFAVASTLGFVSPIHLIYMSTAGCLAGLFVSAIGKDFLNTSDVVI